jgi:hypothetical protein
MKTMTLIIKDEEMGMEHRFEVRCPYPRRLALTLITQDARRSRCRCPSWSRITRCWHYE